MARNTTKKHILKNNPFCIYCGGLEPSTTLDHMPNKGMFPKDRPAGLEFPSCEACNQGAKWFEDVASFIGSVQWHQTDESVHAHFEVKLQHLIRNHSDIVEELEPTARQTRQAGSTLDQDRDPAGALNLQGPLVSNAMLLYGAKLALALHWAERRQILPPSGRIGVIWWSNETAMLNKVPQQLFELLPTGRSLQQGKKTSAYPFQYSSAKTADTDATAHWATFSDAFMYYLFVGESINVMGLPAEHVFAPGCVQTTKPVHRARRVGWPLGPVTLK